MAKQSEWQRAASNLELELAKELQHPFIVPHQESWVDRGHTIHMVHALSEKGDLKALLEAKQVRVPPLAQRIRPHSAMAWLAHH